MEQRKWKGKERAHQGEHSTDTKRKCATFPGADAPIKSHTAGDGNIAGPSHDLPNSATKDLEDLYGTSGWRSIFKFSEGSTSDDHPGS